VEWQELPPIVRKQMKLEAERRTREQEILAFQQANWQEMRLAAKRNKAAVQQQMAQPAAARREPAGTQDADVAGAGLDAGIDAAAPALRAASEAGEDADGHEYAAMLKDMADMVDEGASAASGDSDDSEDEGASHETSHGAKPGHFMLAGQRVRRERCEVEISRGCVQRAARARSRDHTPSVTSLYSSQVQLPVADCDSLPQKVEALRIFLEQALGTAPFLRVYQQLEALAPEDDQAAAADAICNSVGHANVHFIPLVRQLIVTEEVMHTGGGW